jgi:hypothetical protein
LLSLRALSFDKMDQVAAAPTALPAIVAADKSLALKAISVQDAAGSFVLVSICLFHLFQIILARTGTAFTYLKISV